MVLKYFIYFIVAFSKTLHFYSYKKCHGLMGIFEKVHITAKFQKTEFDKYANSGVIAFSVAFTFLTLFRMKGGRKAPRPNSFSPVTFTNVRISHKNFLTLVLTLLPHWCKSPRSYLLPVPNY